MAFVNCVFTATRQIKKLQHDGSKIVLKIGLSRAKQQTYKNIFKTTPTSHHILIDAA